MGFELEYTQYCLTQPFLDFKNISVKFFLWGAQKLLACLFVLALYDEVDVPKVVDIESHPHQVADNEDYDHTEKNRRQVDVVSGRGGNGSRRRR